MTPFTVSLYLFGVLLAIAGVSAGINECNVHRPSRWIYAIAILCFIAGIFLIGAGTAFYIKGHPSWR